MRLLNGLQNMPARSASSSIMLVRALALAPILLRSACDGIIRVLVVPDTSHRVFSGQNSLWHRHHLDSRHSLLTSADYGYQCRESCCFCASLGCAVLLPQGLLQIPCGHFHQCRGTYPPFPLRSVEVGSFSNHPGRHPRCLFA